MRINVGRNAALNAAGAILPAVAGVASAPILLSNLGTERLGLFTLALGVIGFAGIFDLGLSRALTQTISRATGRGAPFSSVSRLVWRNIPVVVLVGCLWALCLAIFAGRLSEDVLQVPSEVARETNRGVLWISFAIPIAVLSSCLCGVLEGLQLFSRVTLVRAPMGVLAFGVPAAGSYFTTDIGHIVALLVGVRLLAAGWWLYEVHRALGDSQGRPDLIGSGAPIPAKSMWKFTGWLTVSNVVGPLMVYADRFYLSTLFSPASIAYYTVPVDAASRATALPQLAMNAVMPAMSNLGAASDDATALLRSSYLLMIGLWVIPIFAIGLFVEDLLAIWMGNEFGHNSAHISHWLLLGVLLNGLAHIPLSLLHASGRADLAAKAHVIELPLYIALLITLSSVYGVLGAAMAWALRVFLDLILLHLAALMPHPGNRKVIAGGLLLSGASAILFHLILTP